jgi:hypothetical protein
MPILKARTIVREAEYRRFAVTRSELIGIARGTAYWRGWLQLHVGVRAIKGARKAAVVDSG